MPTGETVDRVDGPPGLHFLQIQYRMEREMPLHAHEDAASLNLCLSGTLRESRGRQTFLQGPSSLSLIPAGLPHANRFPAGACTFLVVLGALWVERVHPVSDLLCQPRGYQEGPPTWIAARMHREFLRRDDLTPLALEGMLLELVTELARGETPSGGHVPRWLPAAAEFLRAHFTEAITSDAVAAAAGVHPSHLMRAFRRHHGCTIGEYVRRLRVEHARRLLESSDLPLATIALDAGFCDQGHLCRAFKRHTGASPGQFRRSSGRASRIATAQS